MVSLTSLVLPLSHTPPNCIPNLAPGDYAVPHPGSPTG